jgi:hypothetical protein
MICSTLIGTLMVCLGCGGPAGTIDGQLSKQAREFVIQKKVDLKNRPGSRPPNDHPDKKAPIRNAPLELRRGR